MKNTKKISVNGNQVSFHTPAKDENITLIGNVGDPVILYPQRCGLFDKKGVLPDGEKIEIPYAIGKITNVTPLDGDKPNVRYDFVAYLDMEDGTMCKMTGTVFHDSYHNMWRMYPYSEHKVLKISNYRAYTKYEGERNAAYKAFCEEWDAKNPMKL